MKLIIIVLTLLSISCGHKYIVMGKNNSRARDWAIYRDGIRDGCYQAYKSKEDFCLELQLTHEKPTGDFWNTGLKVGN